MDGETGASTGLIGTGTPRQGNGAFDQASHDVLAFLDRHVPLELWSVTRVVGGRQVHLSVVENDLGVAAGDEQPWGRTLCELMWQQDGPQVAPDVTTVPGYRERAAASVLPIGAYMGFPLVLADGTLFGTVLGLHGSPRTDDLRDQRDLLALLGGLLTTTLRADQLAVSLARQLEATRSVADTDPLTGLLNVRAWQAVCSVEEGRHHRLGDEASVIVVDLDDLKGVNDGAGHAAGDQLIRDTARVLRTTIRAGDHVARVGGDEFTVLCPQTSSGEAQVLLARLREAFGAAGVDASLGAGTMGQVTGMQDAQAEADGHMYEAKRLRRVATRRT